MHGRVETPPEPARIAPDDHTLITPLTRADMGAAAQAKYLYFGYMELLHRDAEVMRHVARFGALTTAQIRALLFHDKKSETSCTRSLRRLREAGILASVSVRLPSNSRGGSPMGCYQIGRAAWKSFYTRPYKVMGNPLKLHHTLAVADAYIALKQAERAGAFKISHYRTEPDTWLDIAGVELRPDLYVDLIDENAEAPMRRLYWLEVDQHSEGRDDIAKKVEAYKHAYLHGGMKSFPQVVFVGKDDDTVADLRRWIRPLTRDVETYGDLFVVASQANFMDQLMR
ncbi:hypothetical protein C6Y44_09795 [Rhodococcus rhodochrous]|nr:hypothetical protein C6Y44_09795 [Rhodococcus rhodochrous]